MIKKKVNYRVPDRLYCITPTGLFEPGMLFTILKLIKEQYPDEQVVIDPDVYEIINPKVEGTEVFDRLMLPLRDYQLTANEKALKKGRGILKIGTGGGKTLTLASLISSYYMVDKSWKVIIIVPTLSLVSQTYKDFQEYNVPFSYTMWHGNAEPDLDANVIIANRNIIQTNYDDSHWINFVDMAVIDECHGIKKNNSISKIVGKINTNIKFGCTGTLPENKIDEWSVLGKIGPVLFDKDSFELRKEKYLTPVNVFQVEISYQNPPKIVKGQNNYYNELDFIYDNVFRNNVIKSTCNGCKNNTLVLVNHLRHGETLLELISQLSDKRVYFISGEMPVDERERIRAEMETNNDIICIAMSSIFSTGVNVKNLHNIIFASGGKSFIRIVQSVGRGLRLHELKDKLNIIDIVDNIKYGSAHGMKRRATYKKEQIDYSITKINE
jgi:superfamily II DNA or RNA helicase